MAPSACGQAVQQVLGDTGAPGSISFLHGKGSTKMSCLVLLTVGRRLYCGSVEQESSVQFATIRHPTLRRGHK